MSASLNNIQRKWSTLDKEFFAVVKSIEKFSKYLAGANFIVKTDHKPLIGKLHSNSLSRKQQHWRDLLQCYTFKLEYCPGPENISDCVSRQIRNENDSINCSINNNTDCNSSHVSGDNVIVDSRSSFSCNSCHARNVPNPISDTILRQVRDGTNISDNKQRHVRDIALPFVNVVTRGTIQNDNTGNGVKIDPMTDNDSLIKNNDNYDFLNLDSKSLSNLQRQDSYCNKVLNYLEHDKIPEFDSKIHEKHFWFNIDNFFISSSQVLKYNRFKKLSNQFGTLYEVVVLPNDLVYQILPLIHDSPFSGHLGYNKTKERFLTYFYRPNYDNIISTYVSNCIKCKVAKSRFPQNSPMKALPHCTRFFERLLVDYIGPFPKSSHGKKYCLVFIDAFTKWVEVFATSKNDAVTFATILVEKIICRHGSVPESLLSDRGPHFLADIDKELYKLFKIKKISSSGYRPETSGQVERIMQPLTNHLKIFVEHKKASEWPNHVPYFVFSYNTAVQESTKMSPFNLVYHRDPILPFQSIFSEFTPSNESYLNLDAFNQKCLDYFRSAQEFVSENLTIASESQKSYYDKYNKVKSRVFIPGEKVIIPDRNITPGCGNNKLKLFWNRIATVVKFYGNHLIVKDINGKEFSINSRFVHKFPDSQFLVQKH